MEKSHILSISADTYHVSNKTFWRWRCLRQRHLSAYVDLSPRDGFDNLSFGYGEVLHICICCLSRSLRLIHRSTEGIRFAQYDGSRWNKQSISAVFISIDSCLDRVGLDFFGLRVALHPPVFSSPKMYVKESIFTIHASCLSHLVLRHGSRIVRY